MTSRYVIKAQDRSLGRLLKISDGCLSFSDTRSMKLLPRHAQVKTLITSQMTSNRAVVIDRPAEGQKPELVVRDIEIPAIQNDEVLVRMRLRTINPSDVAATTLRYPGFNRAKNFPAILGLEGLGVVEKVGSSVSQINTGQRVVSMMWGAEKGNGTWQQYKALPAAALIPVPDGVSDEAAAQFLVNPCTAVGFLDVLKIPEGKALIQSAANSELGRMMIHLCKHRGIKTINIVRRKEAVAELQAEGADLVISSDVTEDFAQQVKEFTNGEMAYGAIDPVVGSMTGKLASCVRPGGMVLVYGGLSAITIDGLQLRDLLFRGVIVTGFWISTYMARLEKGPLDKLHSEVMSLLEQKVFQPRSGPKFSLDQVKEAIAASLESGKSGKVFLEG